MKPYDYFLFDWDGTLAKTLEVWLYAYKKTLAEQGARPPDKEIAHHFGDWELPKYFGIEDYEACNAATVDIARENLKEVELYKGAKELLETLEGKKKTALLSSSSKEVLLTGVAHNDLTECFGVILAGEDVSHHKPHPEVIEKSLQALHGSKSQAVMIGDSHKDIVAAHKAGIDSVLLYPPSHELFYNFDDLKSLKPTYVFTSLADLRNSIKI